MVAEAPQNNRNTSTTRHSTNHDHQGRRQPNRCEYLQQQKLLINLSPNFRTESTTVSEAGKSVGYRPTALGCCSRSHLGL